ncbi:MAG: hypothetical protein H0T76_19835 [Nannocystis sp.]|nr:hypothetical protein [Nannocystis sp.]MBA3548739.1 hypothetical protein [Nannocystis sp.]
MAPFIVFELVLDAVAKLHEEGVIHGDMQPENVIVQQTTLGHGSAKVIDLGFAVEWTAVPPIFGGCLPPGENSPCPARWLPGVVAFAAEEGFRGIYPVCDESEVAAQSLDNHEARCDVACCTSSRTIGWWAECL